MKNTPSIPPNQGRNRRLLTKALGIVIACGAVAVYYWGPFSEGESSVSARNHRIIRLSHDHLYDLSFPTKEKGWVVGDYGTILATQDGGKWWSRQETGTHALLRGVDFVDEKRGWAVGVRGTVLHTEDGGQSWAKQEMDARHLLSLDPDVYLRDVHFLDPSRGLIIARTGSIFFTEDGGSHWQEQALEGKDARLNRVRFFSPQVGWMVGEFGSLFVTQDGGRSWKPRESGTKVTLMDIVFLNPQLGYVAGLSGTLLRTQDGGETWEAISIGRKENFFGLSAGDGSGRVWVLGNRFFQWFDGQNQEKLRWHEVMLPKEINLLEAWFYAGQADANGGVWVTGREGVLLHGANGKESWMSVLSWERNVRPAKEGS